MNDEYGNMFEQGHHRPGEGDALGAGERGLDRRDGADDGVAGDGHPGAAVDADAGRCHRMEY